MNRRMYIMAMMIMIIVAMMGTASGRINIRREGQNASYVGVYTAVNLSFDVQNEGWEKQAQFDIRTFSNYAEGLATNMTSWADGCCLFSVDSFSYVISVFDTSGANIRNITMPGDIAQPGGIYTNASGTPVTDFWVVDYVDEWSYHLAADGTISPDPTGNFSVLAVAESPYGVTSNTSSGTPTSFWFVDDYVDIIVEYTATGTYVGSISLPAKLNSPRSITLNDTDTVPNSFIVGNSSGGLIAMLDTTGTIVEEFDTTGVGGRGAWGLDVFMPEGAWDRTLLVDSVIDDFIYYQKIVAEYATLSTNETGTWENKTTYGSPKFVGGPPGWVTADFMWQNTTLDCNRVVGWKLYVNNTIGEQNATGINTFKLVPFIEDASWVLANATSVTCDDKNNISMILTDVPAGWFKVNMSFARFDTVDECAFNATQGMRIRMENMSETCLVELTHGDLPASAAVKIWKWPGLRVAPPSNLPALLAAAAVGIIILVYNIVKKTKSVGWT